MPDSGILATKQLKALQGQRGAAQPPPPPPTETPQHPDPAQAPASLAADPPAPDAGTSLTAVPPAAPKESTNRAELAAVALHIDTASPARRSRSRRVASASSATVTAPPLGERQGDARFQARLTPTLASAVDATVDKIALETGLSRNAIRQAAVWAILGDSSDQAVTAFVRDVLPDWQRARRAATERQDAERE